VDIGRRLDDGAIVAVKKICKSRVLQTGEVASILMERIVLSQPSRWLLPLWEAFQDWDNLYLVTEFMFGGSLEDLSARPDYLYGSEESKKLPEETVQFYMAELLLAIEELHSIGFVHRDVKPGNVLIGRDGHIRLADFGCAARLASDGKDYLAPEVLLAQEKPTRLGTQSDLWSFGVTMYDLLSGDTPFYDMSTLHTYHRIKNHKAKEHLFFKGINWETVSHKEPPFIPMECDDLREYLQPPEEDDEGTITRPFRTRTKDFVGLNLPFVGFTWPRRKLMIAEESVRRKSNSVSSASSVSLSQVSLSEASMRLKTRSSLSLAPIKEEPLVEQLEADGTMGYALEEAKLQLEWRESELREQQMENETLQRKVETLQGINEVDRKKINELVRKLEDTLLNGSPLTSRRGSDIKNDGKEKKMRQEMRQVEQKYLRECQVREQLELELAEIKAHKAMLELELSTLQLQFQNDTHSIASVHRSPPKDARSRRGTGGSFSVFRSLMKSSELKAIKSTIEGYLKIPSISGKKVTWKKSYFSLHDNVLWVGDKAKGTMTHFLSLQCEAFWIQPVGARELPQIPAKQTLECFKIRSCGKDMSVHLSRSSSKLNLTSRNDGVGNMEDVAVALEREVKVREGARQMLDVATSDESL
ncbi:AGC/DMPK/GEK protein kinase, partial [Paramicrosporidium saccamoebae]